MSYQEKNIVVSLVSTVLFFIYYLVNVYWMVEEGNFNAHNVYTLWATVIVLAIIVTIVSSVLTHIIFSILHAIRTNEEDDFIEDERDKLIGLIGTRNSYVVFSIGVFISMAIMVLGMSHLVMFLLLIFSGIIGAVFGDLTKLYLYRRGV